MGLPQGMSNGALICLGEIKGNRAPVHKISRYFFKARHLTAGKGQKQRQKSPKFPQSNGEQGKVLSLLPLKPLEAMQELHLL